MLEIAGGILLALLVICLLPVITQVVGGAVVIGITALLLFGVLALGVNAVFALGWGDTAVLAVAAIIIIGPITFVIWAGRFGDARCAWRYVKTSLTVTRTADQVRVKAATLKELREKGQRAIALRRDAERNAVIKKFRASLSRVMDKFAPGTVFHVIDEGEMFTLGSGMVSVLSIKVEDEMIAAVGLSPNFNEFQVVGASSEDRYSPLQTSSGLAAARAVKLIFKRKLQRQG